MKSWIKCIIAGAIIIVVGLALALGALACNGWSFKKPEFEMQTYTATEQNTSLDITVNAGTVKTEFYDGDTITIDYPSSSVFKSEISEKDGVFKYQSKLKKTWFWGSLNIPETTIRLPKDINYNLDFEVNAGTVNIASGTYGTVEIEVNAGKLNVEQSECASIKCEVNAGSLSVNGLICGKFDCDVSAGSCNVKNLNCPDIKAEISAGSLNIDIDGAKADYDIKADVSAGSCNVSNQTVNGGKKLEVECSAGSVKVNFAG